MEWNENISFSDMWILGSIAKQVNMAYFPFVLTSLSKGRQNSFKHKVLNFLVTLSQSEIGHVIQITTVS